MFAGNSKRAIRYYKYMHLGTDEHTHYRPVTMLPVPAICLNKNIHEVLKLKA